MEYKILTPEVVVWLHENIQVKGEIKGFSGDKSLEGVLGRVENRLSFGLTKDVFDLAASYACVLAVGHVFNDGNKRTSLASMDLCLSLNGIEIEVDIIEVSDLIIKLAQGRMDEHEMAAWLRGCCL